MVPLSLGSCGGMEHWKIMLVTVSGSLGSRYETMLWWWPCIDGKLNVLMQTSIFIRSPPPSIFDVDI